MDYSSQITSTPISQHLHNTLCSFSDLEDPSFSSPLLERSFSEDNLCVGVAQAHRSGNTDFPLRTVSSVGQFLNMPKAPSRLSSKTKSHGRVLTSIENVLIMEENEMKKKMEALRKEEKKKVKASKKAGQVALEKSSGTSYVLQPQTFSCSS